MRRIVPTETSIAKGGTHAASGQKRTFALHQPMSALPPKAGIRFMNLGVLKNKN